ncbi:MAG: uracil phosphoribosyltransferase [Bacteroidota bacterium]|nr:uracil phosphoribosyltransferase [Bacteroidota bacterium]
MNIRNLSENNSILNHFLNQIRDVKIQTDSMRFRRNIERIGEIMSYEISKNLNYKALQVQTPLGVKHTNTIADKIVVCSVLRAGLALHQGFLNYFDDCQNGFVAAYRYHPNNDSQFEIRFEYQALPDISDKILLLVDPMIATGQSLVVVCQDIFQKYSPKEVHIASVIAAPEGIAYLQNHLKGNINLWTAAIDDKLNNQKYIVPGLGDAGDLAYGTKI